MPSLSPSSGQASAARYWYSRKRRGRPEKLVAEPCYRADVVDRDRAGLAEARHGKTGLTVRCELDTGQYPNGIVVSDAEMAAINIKRAEFHGEWNYTISPNHHPPNHAFVS